MKTFYKIINIGIAVILAAGIFSCSKGLTYTPGEAEPSNGVFFLATSGDINPSVYSVLSTDTQFTYWLGRTSTSGSLTVNLVNNSDSKIKVPSSVTFADGVAKVPLVVTFESLPTSDVPVKIEVADPNKSIYGAGTTSLNSSLNCKWSNLGTGYFYDAFGLAGATASNVVAVTLRQSRVTGDENHYLIVNDPYADDAILTDAWGKEYLGGYKNPDGIDFYVTESNNVTWNKFWYSGLIYTKDGDPTYTMKAYLPSALKTDYASQDAKSVYYAAGFAILYPYWYIDGKGGYGTKYPVVIGFPSAFPTLKDFTDYFEL